MSSPQRLLVTEADSELGRLLRAGANERASRQLPRKIMAGLAVSSSAGAAAAAGSAASVGASSSVVATTLTLKWLAAGLVSGVVLAVGASSVLAPPAEVRQPTVSVARRVEPRPALPVRLASTPAPPAPVLSPMPAAPTKLAPPKASMRETAPGPRNESSPQLRREVQLIEAARRALAASAPSEALDQLAQYRAVAITGVLEREARVLDIDARLKLGRLEEAKRLAMRYLREFPGDAHAPRLHALLGTTGSMSRPDDTKQGGEP